MILALPVFYFSGGRLSNIIQLSVSDVWRVVALRFSKLEDGPN
jgi:hypothetical protein